MPARNIIKQYQENGFYHIYNRGVEKRKIFLDERDYKTFLFFLKIYLLDKETLKTELQGTDPCRIERNNFADEIELIAYCLMPNHFHLLIKQTKKYSISRFMRCIATNYSMYFNKRYKRTGTLFQGRYKAVLITNDDYLLHLSRYIHLNPVENCKGPSLADEELVEKKGLRKYSFSSYHDYLGERNTKWVNPNIILEFFENQKKYFPGDIFNYQSFVEDYEVFSENVISDLILED